MAAIRESWLDTINQSVAKKIAALQVCLSQQEMLIASEGRVPERDALQRNVAASLILCGQIEAELAAVNARAGASPVDPLAPRDS